MSNFATYEQLLEISNKISKKVPQGIMLGNTPVGHIEWQMYLQRDYLKLDGTPLANASNDYDELLKFAQDNSLITSDTTDKSLFKYDSTNDVLTLPDYIGLVLQGGNTVEEKEAGLPNIKGEFNVAVSGVYTTTTPETDVYKGAIKQRLITSNDLIRTGADNSWNRAEGFYFDASGSNPIYSDSVTTVQPPAITLIPQIKYIKGTTVWEELDFNKLMPLGTIINFMGTTAPDYYLACDGTIYNILEYSALANFFEVQFGSKNFFGGDGTTTFAVPDLRGEFLRGTGTATRDTGSGDSVGYHQDGTEHIRTQIHCTTDYSDMLVGVFAQTDIRQTNVDKDLYNPSPLSFWIPSSKNVSATVFPYYYPKFTSRPTNTSVLYCIKYK